MSQRLHSETEQPDAGAFLIRDGRCVAGREPDPWSFLEVKTASGEPVFGRLRMLRVFDLRRTFELADGWYEFDAGVTRRVVPDAVGSADFFPDCDVHEHA